MESETKLVFATCNSMGEFESLRIELERVIYDMYEENEHGVRKCELYNGDEFYYIDYVEI